MKRLTIFVVNTLLLFSVLGTTIALGDEVQDVTFSTKYAPLRPTTAGFYYNGRAIGTGREAFVDVVERIGKLATGTSVVWGPNYARCGSCSGDEPPCVPRFLYPDLWEKLETHVKDRRLTLSSLYPGPWPQSVGSSEEGMAVPVALSPSDVTAQQKFAAVLDWEVIEAKAGPNDVADFAFDRGTHWYRFSAAGKTLGRYDLELFFGRIPENGRVLIRVSSNGPADAPHRKVSGSVLAEGFLTFWRSWIASNLRIGKLEAVLTAPPRLAEPLRLLGSQQRLKVDWNNFHGPQTPPEDVLYLANERFVGRGDAGFARILTTVNHLPPTAEVVLTSYQLSGRAAIENFREKELNGKNAKLRKLVPNPARWQELDAAIAIRKLNVRFAEESPDEKSNTVSGWNSGDRYGEAFVSTGRIIRYDEPRPPAAVRLGWTRYVTGDQNEKRQVENEAFYTVNDVEVGQGVAGFAKALDQLAAQPEGAVIQVRVCLRTRGPFLCPLTYEGLRHFERTGFEPYFGMFPWLIDVARTRKLEIQWVPDEQKTRGDCQ